MKIFTYGIEKIKLDALRWHFGKADYIDTTLQYQDILAMCADKVVMAVDHTPENVLQTVKAFQEEVADEDDTEYVYITDEELESWIQDYYCQMEDVLIQVAQDITPDEFEALHLLGIQKYHSGVISKVFTSEAEGLKYYEFYRPEVGKKELLVVSLGDNLIDAATYHTYEMQYDIVSVACYKEKLSNGSYLCDLFERRTSKEELPPILWQLKDKIDEVTKPFAYAYFGE